MKRTELRLFVTAIFLCITCCLCIKPDTALAVPAMPGHVQVVQPNGFVINSHIKGDEFQNWTEADDGYSIIKNQQDSYWYYAVRNSSGYLVPSGIIYLPNVIRPMSIMPHQMPDRNPLDKSVKSSSNNAALLGGSNVWTPVPSSGEKKMLIIMVEFQNRTFNTTPQSWYNAYFDTTPGAKSTANFYKDNSRGKVSITPLATSQSGCPSGVIRIKMSGNHPNYAGNIDYYTEVAWLNEAVSLASAYVDFSALDVNGNGVLDNTEASVNYILAGYEASCTNLRPSIWAHKWQNFYGYPSVISDGIQITPWALYGELDYNGNQLAIGAPTHENAHQIFGLPDLYDTTSTNSGIGIYSLMGAGSWGYAPTDTKIGATPVNLDAWSRQYLGWATPRIPMAEGSMTFGLPTATEDSPVKLADPRVSSKEYFIIENRPPIGWDTGMYCAFYNNTWSGGLLAIHVDENIGTPYNNDINKYIAGSHQGVMVEEASTAYGSLLNNPATFSGNPHEFFYQGNNASFLSSTTPNSKLYDGTNIGVGFNAVSLQSTSMTANVIPCPPVATPTFAPDGGSYGAAPSVTMSCATAGAAIHYTTDGSTPTANSTLYTGAVSVTRSSTLKAIATYTGVPSSSVKSAAYTLPSGPPSNTSLTPNTGSIAADQKTTLTSVYTDPAGFANFRTCYLLINTTLTTVNSGYFYYDAVKNKLYLRKPDTSVLIGGYAPGSAQVIDNGFIALYCAGTTVQKVGNTLTINWNIVMHPYFVGTVCKAWMQVTNLSGLADPMELMGSFNIVVNPSPINVSLTPNAGTITMNTQTTLASLYSDPAGYANIKTCYMMLNSGSNTTGAGYFLYDPVKNKLYLRKTNEAVMLGGFVPGSANVIDNGSVILYCANTTVQKSGNDMTINWRVALKSYFAGNPCKASMQVTNKTGYSDPWEQMGLFSVN